MDKNYNERKYPGTNITVRDVQNVEFEILKEFDRVCKELNIPYQIFAGTLLGAVRHKDFIPWDDDVDVCMLRKDYDVFVNKCPKLLDKKYFLQTNRTDPKSVIQFAKIRKMGTSFENILDDSSTSNTGIWIDIFPLDNIIPDSLSFKIQFFEVSLLYALITSTIKERVVNSKKAWKRIIRHGLYYTMKFISKEKVEARLYKVMTRNNTNNTGYLGNFSNGVGRGYVEDTRKSENFYNMIELPFHGDLFPAPSNYDEILRDTYGDYMSFPPEEKRIPSHGIIRCKI